ncbi:MAG TPA: class I SAM-dependent methyltransferase [Solirubrobacterales bacterium]|nr:class I SAM-dependent methyltransferase [Solirubrobacterales bacterium]
MIQRRNKPGSPRDAYDAFAPIFDEFTAQNDYEAWVGDLLLPELAKHGLRVGRVLDVGCGTGKAFAPLLARGWDVHGCDVSDGMLAEAAAKFPDVPLLRADAAALPAFELDFDLVLVLGDVLNYLVEDGDLERFFTGVARSLAPRGLFLFDSNTIGLMRAMFESSRSQWMSRAKWRWGGMGHALAPGGIFEAELSGEGVQSHIHRQRHWPQEQVKNALEASGLECLAALGQREEGTTILLDETPDEERDAKVIYIAGRTTR